MEPTGLFRPLKVVIEACESHVYEQFIFIFFLSPSKEKAAMDGNHTPDLISAACWLHLRNAAIIVLQKTHFQVSALDMLTGLHYAYVCGFEKECAKGRIFGSHLL